ncbi:MAG: HAD family hydrolase [Lachnospiraceae bacterium]
MNGLIFDVDGTLWDSTPIVEKAWNRAMADMGIENAAVTADQLKGLFGLPMKDIIDRVLPAEPEEIKEKFMPLCFSYEHAFLEKNAGILYPHLEETLSELSQRYPLFIVSNCQAGYIELFLRKTGFQRYFKDFTCPGDTGVFKAENIGMIAERNGLKAPVYVGDTQMDADACKKAGIKMIFASYGFGNVEYPDYTIADPLDLLQIRF